MKDLYVVNCCRTAVGSFGGSLKNTPAADLGAIVVKEALNRAGVKPEQVDELMFGCCISAGLGQNVARQVGIKAGLPVSVPSSRLAVQLLPVMLRSSSAAAPRTCPQLPTSCPTLVGAAVCSTRRWSTPW